MTDIYLTLCRLISDQLPDGSAFPPADWPILIAQARREGVAHLLYRRLESAGWPPSTPPGLRDELYYAYCNSAAANLLAFRELARILSAFNLTIPAIVLKGAALAATLYPSPGLRPLSDLDLLVPADRLDDAVAVLRGLGYAYTAPLVLPGLDQWVHYHAPPLFGGQDIKLAVEVHWSLVSSEHDWRAPDLDWFWQQSELADFGPVRAHVLTPTAHLLYLAAHLMLQHGAGRGRLIWYYDLDLLIRRCAGRLDWDELVSRARQFRWEPALHAALTGAAERFDTPVPAGVLATFHPAGDAEAATLVRRRARSDQTRASRTLAAFSSLTWPARLRLALALVFPTPAYIRWRYKPRPAWLWPLCYPYRWFDEARDGVRTIISRQH
jgi:hypothetical protein